MVHDGWRLNLWVTTECPTLRSRAVGMLIETINKSHLSTQILWPSLAVGIITLQHNTIPVTYGYFPTFLYDIWIFVHKWCVPPKNGSFPINNGYYRTGKPIC